jgi:hypothetical protein
MSCNLSSIPDGAYYARATGVANVFEKVFK